MHTLVTVSCGTWIQVLVLTKGTNMYEWEILFILQIVVEGLFFNKHQMSIMLNTSFIPNRTQIGIYTEQSSL